MTPEILVRDETPADDAAITEVTVAAFETLEISGHTEQFIVAALRQAGALTVSLLAEWNGRVIGHIAFSPVTISEGTAGWFGLGPVSVLPGYQRQGVGTALIQAGISRLRALNARGCCLVGHPGYYQRFGFHHADTLHVDSVPPDVFFALSFDGQVPRGTVTFHEAFKAQKPKAHGTQRGAAAARTTRITFVGGVVKQIKSPPAPIARLLTDPNKTETERFWDAEAQVEKEAETLRRCLDDLRRSTMWERLMAMRAAGMIKREDLSDFSDQLQKEVFDTFR